MSARRGLPIVVAAPSGTGKTTVCRAVVERDDRIEVVVRGRTPGPDEPVHAGLTFPYRLLTIPETGKRVYVRWAGRP